MYKILFVSFQVTLLIENNELCVTLIDIFVIYPRMEKGFNHTL